MNRTIGGITLFFALIVLGGGSEASRMPLEVPKNIEIPPPGASAEEILKVAKQTTRVVVDRIVEENSPVYPRKIKEMTSEEWASLRTQYPGAVVPLEGDVIEWLFSLLTPPSAEQDAVEWEIEGASFCTLQYAVPDCPRLKEAARDIVSRCTLPAHMSFEVHEQLIKNAINYLACYADKDDLKFLRETEKCEFWRDRISLEERAKEFQFPASGDDPLLGALRRKAASSLAWHKPEEAVVLLREILSRPNEDPKYLNNARACLGRAQQEISKRSGDAKE